jgi:glycosyltransferase involved in cell wall biosynthesis
MIATAIAARRRAPQSARDWLSAQSQGPCRDGSVLFHAPSFAFQSPGGGENQLVQTGRHLDELGIAVRLFSPWIDRLGSARLLHLFGLSREGLALARSARQSGVPVVLSPICWYEPRALLALETGVIRKAAAVAAWGARRLYPAVPGWRRELLHRADAILPNSESEARQLVELFGVRPGRIHVIPNGVLPNVATATPALFRARFGDEPFVLTVCRIEPRKNVATLIRAVAALGLKLVVIGEPHPSFADYARECQKLGADRVRWLGALEHHDPLLASAYASARVFALPSWFETPGLAALEAGLAGCPVVITPFGSTRDYFADHAEYARPDRLHEITAAIERSWTQGADPRLARRIANHYLWPKVAEATAEVYDQVAS